MARIMKNEPPRMTKNLPDASIPSGTTFAGNIDTMGGVRVDGTVKGSVKAGGDVTIGAEGAIEGNVTAFNANIAGRVNGKIIATGAVRMLSGSKLTGDLLASSFAIEQGAYYTGKCNITDNKEPALLSAPADVAAESRREPKKKPAAKAEPEKPAEKAEPEKKSPDEL